jgi:CBS domain containing-hemolysin-like protein
MILLPLTIAAALCAALAVASYFHLLYSESIRLRPREAARSLPFFEASLQPRLGMEAETGVQRFAAAKQLLLVLLTLDLAWTLGGREGFSASRLFEALAFTAALVALFAYVTPHVLVTRTSGKWAVVLLWPARLLAVAVAPFLTVIRFSYSIADLGADAKPQEAPPTAEQNIDALIDAGQEEGLLEEEDRKLIQSVVEFGDKTVREVMTPRRLMVTISADASLEDLRQLQIEQQYSRIPIYEQSIDEIIGFVHIWDVLEVPDDERPSRRVREFNRPVLYAPETKRVNDLLREMQEKSVHMSIVIDEYGNTAGLATLEDLVEEIVGEIRDESEPYPDIVEEPDHGFIVSGNLDVDRLRDLIGFRAAQDLESTTVSGLVTERLGHVPAVGEELELDGIRIEVLASNGLLAERLRVRRLEPPAALEETA